MTAAGAVCGNTISVDVVLGSFSQPVQGATLYNVTALAFGRNADTDLYADVDATPSFDYALAAPPAALPVDESFALRARLVPGLVVHLARIFAVHPRDEAPRDLVAARGRPR